MEGRSAPTPRVDVLVAVFDEAATIAGKIADLEALDYSPDRLRFLIVDGGSTDGTAAQVAAWAARDPRVDWLAIDVADKAAQLNAALDRSTADWVLVTDADARMPAGTLLAMIEQTRKRPGVAVVGALASTPGHEIERLHWRLSNWIRRRESRFGTTGLVVATCYLFRRGLIDRFPDDCAADDVHVACRAAATGARVGLAEVTVVEIRSPSSGWGVLRHKVRRTRGYLREVLRFLPALSRMPWASRAIFGWRALALFGIPVLTAAALLALGLMARSATVPDGPAVMTTASLGAVFGGLWALKWRRTGRRSMIVLYPALTLCILSLALLSYPFSRKTAKLDRIGSP